MGLLADFSGPLGFNQIPILQRLGILMLYLRGGANPGGPRGANLAAMEDLVAAGVDLEFMRVGSTRCRGSISGRTSRTG